MSLSWSLAGTSRHHRTVTDYDGQEDVLGRAKIEATGRSGFPSARAHYLAGTLFMPVSPFGNPAIMSAGTR
jgi:hypothetical protein